MTEVRGFNVAAVLELTGLTHRQLVHWDKTGLVRPSLRSASGSGSRRLYSFQDLVELQVVGRLRRDLGVSLQAIRRAVGYLRASHDRIRPLSSLRFLSDGRSVFVLTDKPKILEEATACGQCAAAFVVPIGGIALDLRSRVTAITAPHAFKLRVRGTTYRAVARRDLEVGGYTVAFPDLPSVFTEGRTLAESRSMAREAIEAHLGAGIAVTTKSARGA